MKLKLDLHTHVWEAFNFAPPSVEIAEMVVTQIKSKGIDGARLIAEARALVDRYAE